MIIRSLEVYNWHQFVIVITCSDNVCPYIVLVHVSSSLGVKVETDTSHMTFKNIE